MKYDCNKTMDYSHEFGRMCKTYGDNPNGCDDCPLSKLDAVCDISEYITKEHIDIVQKWSDSHPTMTRREKLKKLLEQNGFENVEKSFASLSCGVICPIKMECKECKEYWDEEVTS